MSADAKKSYDPDVDDLLGQLQALIANFIMRQGGHIHLGRVLGALDLLMTSYRAQWLENQGFMRLQDPSKTESGG